MSPKSRQSHFADVYDRYYRKIYSICRRYSPRPDDAEDLAHEVFLRYFQNFGTFRQEACPSTWMYRVAVNLGIVRWRKERAHHREDTEVETLPSGIRDNETALLDRIALEKVMGRYSEPVRRILLLHHVDRMTQSEIGRHLRVSRATVARHLVRTRLAPTPGPTLRNARWPGR